MKTTSLFHPLGVPPGPQTYGFLSSSCESFLSRLIEFGPYQGNPCNVRARETVPRNPYPDFQRSSAPHTRHFPTVSSFWRYLEQGLFQRGSLGHQIQPDPSTCFQFPHHVASEPASRAFVLNHAPFHGTQRRESMRGVRRRQTAEVCDTRGDARDRMVREKDAQSDIRARTT